jgi:hypothetical protein
MTEWATSGARPTDGVGVVLAAPPLAQADTKNPVTKAVLILVAVKSTDLVRLCIGILSVLPSGRGVEDN